MLVIVALVLAGWPAQTASAAEELPPPHLGYGMLLAFPPAHRGHVKDAGFDWFKYFIYWNAIEPARDGVYTWETVDWRLDEACAQGLHLLLRVERDSKDWTPIRDHEMDGWQAMFAGLAAHIAQRRAACDHSYRVAVEIWNEPNLDFQWGHEPVDPAQYTEMVQRAYLGVKAVDPTLLVVAGGLAPTGGLPAGQAMNDIAFLEAMYAHGLSGHFDVISIHNYGFGGEPEDKAHGWDILNFRRAEDIYAVMVAQGDGDKPVWSTEYGWLLDAASEGVDCTGDWEHAGFAWQRVSAEQQADYLQRSFAYADAHWPWMGVMFVSNLDFSTPPWYTPCEPMRWFALLKPDGTPRPAYTALQAMDKRPINWLTTSELRVTPPAFAWSVRLREAGVITETVTVASSASPFAWSAVTTTRGLPFSITPTTGVAGDAFQVIVDARDLLTGTYTGAITVTTADAQVTPRVITIPLELELWGAWGMRVRPASLRWLMAEDATHPVSAIAVVENTGDFAFEWEVTAASETLSITVIPASSTHTASTTLMPGAFQVFVNPRGLALGEHTGTLTITASETAVPESPFSLPISVHIVKHVYTVYLPLIMRQP